MEVTWVVDLRAIHFTYGLFNKKYDEGKWLQDKHKL